MLCGFGCSGALTANLLNLGFHDDSPRCEASVIAIVAIAAVFAECPLGASPNIPPPRG